MKKKFFLVLVFLFKISVFSQQVLNNLNTSWSSVLSGVVLCEPAITSYGFCVVTDARTVSAFSSYGNLLWEKNVGRSRNVILQTLNDDYLLYADLNTNSLILLNPSGTEIWNKNLGYKLYIPPFSGRDGRFFLSSGDFLECYGINGIRKWRISVPAQKKINIQELPDGSIVVFLKEIEGQTKGYRISPFGEILEEIVFAGEVSYAATSSDGILLIFTDGSAGLFSVSDNLSENKWVLPKKNKNAQFLVSRNSDDYIYAEMLADGIIINELNKSDGSIRHSFKIKEIFGLKIQMLYYDESGIFFMDNKSAGLYSTDGKELWCSKLPAATSKNNWNYTVYTNDNHLIFCYKNWTLNAYRVIQVNNTIRNNSNKDYSSFLTIGNNFETQYSTSFSNVLIDDERIQKLRNGDYGVIEKKYHEDVVSICNAYSDFLSTSDFGTRKEKSIFELDSAGFEKILNQLMFLGNRTSQNLAANILGKTKNNSFQKVILQGIHNNGYDPDAMLLKSLEKLSVTVSYKDKTIINSICDAVYSICFFMGRPAYNSKGKDILKNFLYPSYDAKNREYARETLKKIIALDL